MVSSKSGGLPSCGCVGCRLVEGVAVWLCPGISFRWWRQLIHLNDAKILLYTIFCVDAEVWRGKIGLMWAANFVKVYLS